MDSKKRQHLVLERITGVLWFFLCLFGALASIGVFFFRAKLPDWELYLQLGFTGGPAAMVILGSLQLSQAFVMKEKPMIRRLTKASGFLLGCFGALLAFGVFFEILKYPNAGLFMRWGLLGTAATLVLTGGLILGEVNLMETPEGKKE
jgi:hypothetical protein